MLSTSNPQKAIVFVIIILMNRTLERIDGGIIHLCKKIAIPFSRFSLFVVFFWFGILKIIGNSPANPMVQSLMEATLPFMTWSTFIVLFSIYEMIIGVSFILPKFERFAVILLAAHMVMTGLPLFFLPDMTWQAFMVPTMEGQYIIKNLVLIAVAIGIVAHLVPLGKRK